MIVYLENGEFKITHNPQKIALESCMQELLLWLGENPMSSENGIDYFGVMDGFVYLKASVEEITERYTDSFVSILVKDPIYNEQAETLSIGIDFTLNDYSIINKEVSIGLK